MSQDTIGDMLTRIRNANHARHHYVTLPYTRVNHVLCGLLVHQGYAHELELQTRPDGRGARRRSRSRPRSGPEVDIVLRLKYRGRYQRPVIHHLSRESNPGLRRYSQRKHLPRVLNGMGTVFISTSAGIMTDRAARRKGLGGEVLCSVW